MNMNMRTSKINSARYSNVLIEVTERLIEQVNPESSTTPLSGQKVIHYPNDVGLLMNVEKIRKFSPDSVESLLSEFSTSSSSFSQQIKDMPKDKIIATLKSRYIQSAADVHSFNRWLKANFEYEMQDLLDKNKNKNEEQDSTSQTSSTSNFSSSE